MINCKHCNCNISSKPWITYRDDNYCSYLCGKERPMYYTWEDVTNKEDFNYNLVPIVKKKKTSIHNFSLLMDSEISELSDEEYNEYMDQLDEFKYNNPERYSEMCDIMYEYTDYDDLSLYDDGIWGDGYYSDDYDTEDFQ